MKALMEVESFLNPPGGPGFWEGMIPVWGSGSTAGAHFANGRPIAGTFFAILGALEITGLPALARLATTKAAQYLAKEAPDVTVEALMGMAKQQGDCVAQAIAYDSVRSGRIVPAVIPVPGTADDILSYAGRYKMIDAGDAGELLSHLRKYGDGSGGIVVGHRPGRKGHAFNWEVANGEVRLWDPQQQTLAQLSGQDYAYFSWVSTMPTR